MSDNKKPINKKPKISPFWIYGFIIVIFLGIQMVSGGMGSSVGIPTTQGKFFEYLENGDIDKVIIINIRNLLYQLKRILYHSSRSYHNAYRVLPHLQHQQWLHVFGLND